MITLITVLFLKHFLVDFPLQTPFMYLNKGIYGHGGGVLHALLHGMATAFILATAHFYGLVVVSALLVVWISVIEAIVHYHIDWLKVNINKRYGLRPDNSEKFWWLLGADQLLHSLTYIAIVAVLF